MIEIVYLIPEDAKDIKDLDIIIWFWRELEIFYMKEQEVFLDMWAGGIQ